MLKGMRVGATMALIVCLAIGYLGAPLSMPINKNVVKWKDSHNIEYKNFSTASSAGFFDFKDDGGRPLVLHDVRWDGHMELYSNTESYVAGSGWCIVGNTYNLKGGRKATFSVSGHICGEVFSPTLEEIGQIEVYLKLYRGIYYHGANPFKEKMIYYKTNGKIDKNVSGSITVDGSEISDGLYSIAFMVVICASGRVQYNDMTHAYADFHTGEYGIDVFSADASQDGSSEEEPDLAFDGMPTWEPNPPKRYKDIYFTVRVKNIGKGKVKTYFNIALYIDDDRKNTKSLDGPGKVKLNTWWPNDKKTHKVKIVIDDDNNVDEIDDYTNNVWTKSISASKNYHKLPTLDNLIKNILHFFSNTLK